ncbi:MAG: hypothetical protein GTO29_11975 [Candidatus Latescibacteria bacterium]|nr:hypothetical protein [Candidatus Latescibacterota bacterium]NIO56882.1 hypothetical protein [Candidatus Latescibacterota bacterium]
MRKSKSVIATLALSMTLGIGFGSQAGESPTAYFVIAGPLPFPFYDSYVLPLSDSADIAFARQLIANGEFKIAVARIAPGADGINRDMYAPGMPEWSWHVTEFLEFADCTIEICDGSPTLVEQDVDGWMASTDMICFWTYTVVEEIPPSVPVEEKTWSRIKQLYKR